jgi:hypothetical protein
MKKHKTPHASNREDYINITTNDPLRVWACGRKHGGIGRLCIIRKLG